MDSFYYFPCAVYRDERPDLVEKLLPVVDIHIDSSRQSDESIIQSGCLLSSIDDEIKDYILYSSIDILASQGYTTDNYRFYISNMWAQEFSQGSSTDIHVHSNSQISGWIFLECTENSVHPIFYDARMNKQMVELESCQGEEITNATRAIRFNNLVPGSVIFTNSWLQGQLVCGGAKATTKCIHFIISHKDLP